MAFKTTLLKIKLDLEAGRKGLAVKRLRSLIKTDPTNIGLRNRLAEIYYDAGFIDTAGLYWFLSEPINDKMRKSVAIYEQSAKSAQQILNDLGRLTEIEEFDDYAMNKLAQYKRKCRSESDTFKPPSNKRKLPRYSDIAIILFIMVSFVWGVISVLIFVIKMMIKILSWLF